MNLSLCRLLLLTNGKSEPSMTEIKSSRLIELEM